jgi:error-prone DNA polymerase
MSHPEAGYIELHCHSVFSLQDGAGEPEALIGRARELGMPALALTDHDDLGGAVRFAQAAATADVGGILGVELTVRVPARTHLVLLAETREGYGNLCSLVTRARLDTPRGDPSVTLDTLARHANGLVALTGCPRGWVPRLVARGEDDAACSALATLADIFERRVWVECWDHHLPEERAIVRGLLACARALGLPWVVTNDVHYVHARDRIVHDVLLALKHKLPLDQMGTRLRPNGEWYLKGAAQVRRRWQHDDAGVRATLDVAERCAFRLGDLKPSLPVFALPSGVSADEYLMRLVAQGAHERWGPPGTARRTAKHDAQLRHELGMISRLGLAGYFLIVWDIVRFARREGILCQGRGSAANSAVCYCLAITAVDPIKLELLFERFLSEERKEAPDIDIDIAHEERERVLQYVYERYGREHAAMVCEHITWRGRSAVRDAARVLGFSVEQADALAMFSDRFSAKATAEALRTGSGADPFAPAWEDTVGPANYEKERDAARALEIAARRPERSEGPASGSGDKRVLRSAQDDRAEADRIGQAMMPGRRSVERMQEDRAIAERLGRGMVRGTEATTIARRVKAEARAESGKDNGKDKGNGFTTEAQSTQRSTEGAAGTGDGGADGGVEEKQVLRSAQDDNAAGAGGGDNNWFGDPTARAIAGVSEGDALLRRVGLDPNDHRVRMLPAIVAGLHQAPRHRSIHVGGFVLTREPLLTVVPIEPASMADRTVIQWEKDDLDPVGLVKIDLLGLGMLTVLQLCLTYVRQVRGTTIDLGQLDMADQSVFDDLCAADTIGVFQVESRAQMNTLPRLKPRCFYDLVVEVALIRPGPIQGEMVHPYLRRKNGEEPVTYPHPSLEPILKRTLGVPLFQEQGMQVAIAAAGFTGGQADQLRRAMGHKRSHERMAAICEQMIEGMKANGIPDDIARRIYNQINAFADYGFPESHAASFALIVYASAYLRHYYAPEYLAAMLNAQPMGFYAPGTLIEDAKRHGVEVRAVDLTVSGWDHVLEARTQDAIPAVRLGLRLVRGLGSAARTKLETALADGPFTNIADVVQRTQLDRKALRVLAESGAFDTMVAHEPPEKRRRAALWQVLAAERGTAGPLAPRHASNASGTERVPAMTRLALTEADYRMTGVSLAGHPMIHARAALKREGARTARDLLAHGRDDTWTTTAGLVICRQRPGTAKGFVFLTLEDETGMLNVVITPKLFEQHALLVTTTPLLVVRGVLQVEGRVVNLKARAFRALDVQAGAEHYRSHDFR